MDLYIPGVMYPHQVATVQSVRQIWHFIWQKIQSVRKTLGHHTHRPRLQTLRILEGSHRRAWDIPRDFMYFERHKQTIFEARLSERDDLAEQGYADVVCLGLEALHNRYGKEPQEDVTKAALMQQVYSRASEGPGQIYPVDLGNQLDLLRPLKTSLLELADAS